MKEKQIKGGQKNLLNLLVLHNVVTGCTAGMNRSLVDKALPIPQEAVVHDWWLAMVAAHCGNIIFDNRKLIKYRLHQDNAFGLNPLLRLGNAKKLLQFKETH